MKRIFVYGSLRKGEYNYRPEMGEPVATGYIEGADLYSLGAFPCIVATDDKSHKVVGEVYDLADNIFNPIEAMELGAGYTRLPVLLEVERGLCDPDCPCGCEEHDVLKAEAYFYPAPSSWATHVPHGDWVRYQDEQHGHSR